MLNIKSHREKDSLILVALICSLAGIAFMTIASHGYINAVTNNTSNTNNNNSTIHITATANNILITNILAKNLENHIQKAGSILGITSKLPQVTDTSYAHLLNQTLSTLHGIPRYADTEKRQVAKNIIASNSDLYKIYFIMPNGDMYFLEPYSTQQTLTKNNYAFRDYFQGAIKTNDTYLGNVIIATAASHPREAVIAVPVYSLRDNSTIAGVWAGSIDFNVLNKELQSLNITSSSDGGNNTHVVYVDNNGQKIADSDINKSKTPESFANLNSFKNAINGQSGSIIDTVDNTQMLVTYQPVKAFHNTWIVLLIQSI
ncbi:MAG: cache domain-containing protein [Nitrososphaeraceae archaeon]